MILRIIAVGRLRERFWQEAAADYIRRLRPYARLEVVEVAISSKEGLSPVEEMKAMEAEGEAILKRLKRQKGSVLVLDRTGDALDSQQWAEMLEGLILQGQSEVAFIIGGPLGLAPAVLDRADMILSFSEMTFPHQMMRVILLEQIYRSFRIIRHEPYHK
ncbi:MAG: 23S rRNA (pseudouridine(1915)-N(3))-methyltransferase RlmH [Methanothrix sp.]|jgi:23S rRNA (pseudouridine1915-N3)-methyltransferase|uniref:23S rRNA (pseudouridine(1915)-N(3))-methyltransferase RlmH n=1 Tax=Methanothrix sp. TaxID=90426 RepID=UPI001BD38D7B|nr:23S rRNA (pseudouridine(1915)-N(3))-methyltransferase RlmH [Methanothrix sp.]MBK7385852.1 23S rRNA (pseudouridine(1915)-N(3))-methyltransferase RlmH [Methanothrix sp.]HPW72946.1 23S rRNA (pseudouridine(1915)-N(3))-methyltransferase RlmH [Methanothrix sp.]